MREASPTSYLSEPIHIGRPSKTFRVSPTHIGPAPNPYRTAPYHVGSHSRIYRDSPPHTTSMSNTDRIDSVHVGSQSISRVLQCRFSFDLISLSFDLLACAFRAERIYADLLKRLIRKIRCQNAKGNQAH